MAQDQRQEKIYCGKAVERTSQWGPFFSVNLCLTEIPEEHVRTLDNGKRYVNLRITEMRQPDDRGNTHTVLVDTWKPDGQRQSYQPRNEQPRPRQSTQAPPETELCTEAVGSCRARDVRQRPDTVLRKGEA